MSKIKLVEDTINKQDIAELVEWLTSGDEVPRLTKGPLTTKLEEKWSNWLGPEHTVFCNSGSSANLLMLWALVEANRVSKDCKVVVPAISWATDLSPVIQLGMTPILCDCNLDDLSIDLDHFNKIAKEEKPDVLILVSVLGLVPRMDKIIEICNNHNIILLEDTCESMGSKFQGKKLGNFGLMSSFSTYFGHHISTIEGGFVSTNDEEIYEVLKCIRSHGWTRDSSEKFTKEKKNKWNTSDFDLLYKFYYSGFNLRSTDLQAFIGLGQIDKLDHICNKRSENFLKYNLELNELPPILIADDRDFISNFAYPLISDKREKIINNLQEKDIEVRPLICGSMGHQPFYVERYGRKSMKNADLINRKGLYVPNHQKLSNADIMKVINTIKESLI
jgi:CDP-6-deoxy-D-xylo-4-hexulose-3-dehydrase